MHSSFTEQSSGHVECQSCYKLDTFEINTDCSGWFHTNVKIEENKKRTLFSGHVYHTYKGKKVIGYICGGEEPQ